MQAIKNGIEEEEAKKNGQKNITKAARKLINDSDQTEVSKEKVATPEPTKKTNAPAKNEKTVESTVYFTVQFFSSGEELQDNAKVFKDISSVSHYKDKGLYKYISGKYKTMQQASAAQAKLKEQGYLQAFIIAFKGNERITIPEAKKLLEGTP